MQYCKLKTILKHCAIFVPLVLLFAFFVCVGTHLPAPRGYQQNTPEPFCEISSLDHVNIFEVEIPGGNSPTQELPDKNKKKPCSFFKQYNTFWICASKSAGCEIHNFDNSHIDRIPNSEHLWRLNEISSLPSPVRAGPCA